MLSFNRQFITNEHYQILRQIFDMNDYQRIEQAIRFLERNFSQQPSLKEVADHIGLSEFHFQRLFKRWAGISPKRFLQILTAQFCGSLLRDSNSILDTSLEAGLSSSSRLHDLMVNVYAMTPGDYREFGKDLSIQYGWHPSPFGVCLMGITEKGLCWLSFHSDKSGLQDLEHEWKAAKFKENPDAAREVIQQIFHHSNGVENSIALHLKGTNLQIRVWKALLSLTKGEVASYTQIAQMAERPLAVRAVASAVGRNSISYLIPCHRVIRATGAIGGYRWGVTRKRALLAWETAQQETNSQYAHRSVDAR